MRSVMMGLVLRQTKVKEADCILTILTPEKGLISAVARGCLRLKSQLFSGCGLFCYSEFSLFEGRSLYTVDEAQVQNNFFGLRQSVEGMALAMYLAEMTLALSPVGEEAAAQLRLMLNSFYLLSQNKKSPAQIKAVYELRTACGMGYMPDLLCCKKCGRYDGTPFRFDMETGSLLCAECAGQEGESPNLDGAALTALRHIALSEDKKIFSFTLKEESLQRLGAVTEGYILRRLDRPLKSLNFWKNLTLPGQ